MRLRLIAPYDLRAFEDKEIDLFRNRLGLSAVGVGVEGGQPFRELAVGEAGEEGVRAQGELVGKLLPAGWEGLRPRKGPRHPRSTAARRRRTAACPERSATGDKRC